MSVKQSCILALTLAVALLSCNDGQEGESTLKAISAIQINKVGSICQSYLVKGNTIGFSVAIAHLGEYIAVNRWGEEKPSVRVLSEEDGRLIWDNPDTKAPGVQLFPIGNHSFSWEPYPFDEFKFHLVDGKVVACSEYNDGFFVKIRMKK